ncbi:MAG: OmpA family protein [Proteobacteria bacterium]|nr:OmpA family protein [Pseudomonadota bacterium]
MRNVQIGAGHPSVTFSPSVSGTVDVSLSCSGRAYALSGAIQPGKDRTVTLDGLGVGVHRCSGRLRLNADDGTAGEMPLSISVQVHDPLQLQVAEAELDLDERTMWVESTRPLKSVTATVVGEGGAILGEDTLAIDGMTRFQLPWTQRDGEVLQIRVVGTDSHDLSGELVLSPWSYAIPHEDVIFASGKHDVPSAEVVKLEAAWSELESVRQRYGDVVQVKLYVAGYTDTVGPAASNQALSERRAKAIAAWFRSRGFSEPIYFQGFGESALATPTPDQTDEAKNRRALYVVAAQSPPVSTALPKAAWISL